MSFKDLARQLRQPVPGKALTFGAPQSQIRVMVDGQTITAIAANHINSSDVAVTVDSTGQARVWSATSPIKTNRRTGQFLHIEEDEVVTPVYYPIKILFSLENEGNIDLYIGGDRPKPKFIYQIPSTERANLLNSYLSNTGKSINDFVVGLHFTNKLMNIYNDAVYTYQGLAFDRLVWVGGGFWAYSLEGLAVQQVNLQQTRRTEGRMTYTTTTADIVPVSSLLSGSGQYFSTGYSDEVSKS